MIWRRSKQSSNGVYLEPEVIENLQTRPARIEGHVRGVRKMLDEKRDCDDIATQVAGVDAAIRQVAIVLLRGHLDACVSHMMLSGPDPSQMERLKNTLTRVLR